MYKWQCRIKKPLDEGTKETQCEEHASESLKPIRGKPRTCEPSQGSEQHNDINRDPK
jgi:hypothetical protein